MWNVGHTVSEQIIQISNKDKLGFSDCVITENYNNQPQINFPGFYKKEFIYECIQSSSVNVLMIQLINATFICFS